MKNSAFINADPSVPVIPIYDEGFTDGVKVGTFYGWIFGMITMTVIVVLILIK